MTDLQAMLRQFEGERLMPYVDTVGKITVGIGHNLTLRGITQAVSDMMFSEDCYQAICDARACTSIYEQLSRPRQLVLISMAFQMGKAGLGKWVHFLNALHSTPPDYEECARQLLNSKAHTQAPQRFQTLATMMRENTSAWV